MIVIRDEVSSSDCKKVLLVGNKIDLRSDFEKLAVRKSRVVKELKGEEFEVHFFETCCSYDGNDDR